MIYAPHVLSKPNESPDLTAARARIAELDSMLDRSCSAYQDDIERLNARIAELEDWQRRAVSWMLMQGADVKSPFVRAKLVGEAPV